MKSNETEVPVMQEWLKRMPLGLCVLYGFYPLVKFLGDILKFGYELRSPELSAFFTAAISAAASFLLLRKKPAYSRSGRVYMVLMLPLCCIHVISMLSVAESIFAIVLCGISFAACCILFFAQNFCRWYTRISSFIVLLPMLAYTSLFLLMAPLFLNFGNVEFLRSYEQDGLICNDYYVDEGALGEGWYTDVYSKDSFPLVFGRFYPHYERIIRE